MPAKLAIHVPTQAVAIHVLADGADLTLGRSPDNACVLAHDSVSRRHARLFNDGERWIVEDLGSKNGVRVNGSRVERAELADDLWLAIGDVFCEFEKVAPEAVAHLNARAQHRRQSSQLWIDRVAATTDSVDKLVETLLGGIVDIAECRRGFLLVMDAAGTLRVRACHAMDASDLDGAAFSGSRSAVDRSISERRSVFFSDRRDQDWLRDKASVVVRGIRALASIPLVHDGRLLGIAYADTDDAAKIFTELDASLLEAFAERAAAVLAASELSSAIFEMENAVANTPFAGAVRAVPTWSR